MRKTPHESPAVPMSNNATDPVELNVFGAPIKTAVYQTDSDAALLPY